MNLLIMICSVSFSKQFEHLFFYEILQVSLFQLTSTFRGLQFSQNLFILSLYAGLSKELNIYLIIINFSSLFFILFFQHKFYFMLRFNNHCLKSSFLCWIQSFSILFCPQMEISSFWLMQDRPSIFMAQMQIKHMEFLYIITLFTIKLINKTYMTNPFYWQFPKRSDTMYMSTIQNKTQSVKKMGRDSSFLINDIQGASPKQQIPINVTRENFNNSSFIEPRPEFYRSVKKISDPLKHNDIQGSWPDAVQFKTKRSVNPLIPRYKLPSHNPIDVQPPAKFLRNTLDISDIVNKNKPKKFIQSPKNQKVQGSQPTKLFRTLDAVSRLQVKDINKDGVFVSNRTNNPTDPLNPVYQWRDRASGQGFSFTKPTLQQQRKQLNRYYGQIHGSQPKRVIPLQTKKQFSMYVKDIEGAHANSYNQSRYFNDKRSHFRNYMNTDDIQKSFASSLNKGIYTKRSVNPLMPNYNYPS